MYSAKCTLTQILVCANLVRSGMFVLNKIKCLIFKCDHNKNGRYAKRDRVGDIQASSESVQEDNHISGKWSETKTGLLWSRGQSVDRMRKNAMLPRDEVSMAAHKTYVVGKTYLQTSQRLK